MLIIIYEDSRTAKSCSILLNFLVKGSIIKKRNDFTDLQLQDLSNICDGGFKVNKRSTNKTCSTVHEFYNNTLYCCINNSVYEMQKQPFTILTGKHLLQRIKQRYIPVDTAKFLRAAFFTEHC